MPQTTHLFSLIIFFLYYLGLISREKKSIHVPLMLLAYLSDVILVLYIELNNQAINTAMSFPSGILGVHIIFAILSLVLSTILVVFGSMLFFGNENVRKVHRSLAYIFFVIRFLNYFTSLIL